MLDLFPRVWVCRDVPATPVVIVIVLLLLLLLLLLLRRLVGGNLHVSRRLFSDFVYAGRDILGGYVSFSITRPKT